MPVINIEFDRSKVSKKGIISLSRHIQKSVSSLGFEDAFVYANSSQIQFKTHPIEIFVQVSSQKIPDPANTMKSLKSSLSSWKKKTSFKHPINLTLIPMEWRYEKNI